MWSARGLLGLSLGPLAGLVAPAVGVDAHPRAGLVVGLGDGARVPVHLLAVGPARVRVGPERQVDHGGVGVAALPSGERLRVGPAAQLRAAVGTLLDGLGGEAGAGP